MKILCPTDLSDCSLNAIDWILDYTKDLNNIEIEILHCIETGGSLKIFESIVEHQKSQAESFFKLFLEKINRSYANINVKINISYANAKSYIPIRAREIKAEYIVIGTNGLSQLKDISVGSVAEYVINHAEIPVLCIPPDKRFKKLTKLVIGVDQLEIKDPSIFKSLNKLTQIYDPVITIAQVKKIGGNQSIEFDLRIEEHLATNKINSIGLEFDKSVINTINTYALTNGANMVCFLHRKKKWFRNMFRQSITKEGLYDLEFPFIVISD